MKIYLIVLIIFFNSIMILAQMKYIRLIQLPENAKVCLNIKYGKWDFFNSAVPFFDSTGSHTAWEYKDIISGDFDGNGKLDFALLVKPNSLEHGYFIVLLRQIKSYKLIEICEVPYYNDLVLYKSPKGTYEYSYNSGREIKMPIDGISLCTYEKAGSTYYYNGKKFVHFTSSD